MKVLITGGCGFLGSNISDGLLAAGHEVTVFDNLSRLGAGENLTWLKSRHPAVTFRHGDIRMINDVEEAVRDVAPDAVLNLAGQVAMTTSIASPLRDFDINARGTLNVLEAVRLRAPNASVLFSSTNKVYGDLEQITYREEDTRYVAVDYPTGFAEDLQLEFSSPYGCSKGAAEQYVLDYNRVFGLKTAVFRHSSMYGGRQFATADQGWIGWFCSQFADEGVNALNVSGNGKQVRDLLHAEDMKALYLSALANIDDIAGEAFNIGGGMKNSLSLLELFQTLSDFTGRDLPVVNGPARQSDQKVFVADIGKAQSMLGWSPKVDYRTGLTGMLEWSREILNTKA